MPFNESLRMFDRGKSAFHGEHIKSGVFGPFLECIKNGEIASGSVLVVEEIDRVSRLETTKGLRLVLDIVDYGVTIFTPSDDTAYSSQTLNQGQIWKLIAKLETAHDESKKKSERGKLNWQYKRQDARDNGKLITNLAPDWFEREPHKKGERAKLVLGKSNKPVVIPTAKKSFVMMFKLKESGLGYRAITKQLNRTAPWSPPAKKKRGRAGTTSGWNLSYVKTCLRNRALIGEYQPHQQVGSKRIPDGEVISDYWPAVVEAGLFHRVQQMLAKTLGKSSGGRTGKFTNVLTRLVRCAYCGEAMHLKPSGVGGYYLYCSARTKSGCDAPQIDYGICEGAIIEQCCRLKPEQVLPKKSENTKLLAALRQKVERSNAELADIQVRIENFNDQIGRTKNARQRDSYESNVLELRDQEAALEKAITTAQAELHNAERNKIGFAEWQANIDSLRKALATGEVDIREKLNGHLRDFIDHIEVFTRGYPADYVGDDYGDYFYAVVDGTHSKQERQFVKWVAARQRTKAGCFLRIHFKYSDSHRELMRNGKGDHLWADDLKIGWGDEFKGYIDVVPHGSIAGHPNPDPLWIDFKSSKKPKPR